MAHTYTHHTHNTQIVMSVLSDLYTGSSLVESKLTAAVGAEYVYGERNGQRSQDFLFLRVTWFTGWRDGSNLFYAIATAMWFRIPSKWKSVWEQNLDVSDTFSQYLTNNSVGDKCMQ